MTWTELTVVSSFRVTWSDKNQKLKKSSSSLRQVCIQFPIGFCLGYDVQYAIKASSGRKTPAHVTIYSMCHVQKPTPRMCRCPGLKALVWSSVFCFLIMSVWAMFMVEALDLFERIFASGFCLLVKRF